VILKKRKKKKKRPTGFFFAFVSVSASFGTPSKGQLLGALARVLFCVSQSFTFFFFHFFRKIMTKPILYIAYGTRASKVLWLIRTLGVDVELRVISMQKGEHKAPEYVAKNAHGAVPTLELPDGQHLFESGAIIHYLLETYDKENKLTGPVGSAPRNTFLCYNAFAAEAEGVAIPYFLHTVLYPPQMRSADAAADAKKKWDSKIQGFYSSLLHGKTGFANGTDHFSALDVVVGYTLAIAARGGLVTDPEILAYVGRVTAHPQFGPAHTDPANAK
jgi:glutathione S-transferase